jgi:lipopolysaccharide export system permease protein
LLLPYTYAHTEQIERAKIKKMDDNLSFKRNNIWFRSQSYILQAHLFEPKTRTLHGVVIWSVDGSMNPVGRIDAETASYREGGWILYSPVQKKFLTSGGFEVKSAKSMNLDINLKVEDLQVLERDADNMSIRVLKEYADNLKRGGYHVSILHYVAHQNSTRLPQ